MIDQETLKAFDTLYYATYNNVLKYVICKCNNMEDVKDIVQNVYVEVFNKLKRNNSISMNNTYIIGIAKNKIKEYYRFNYKAKLISIFSPKEENDDLELIDNVPDNINLEEYIVQKDDLHIIWSYLKKKKKVVFKIFYLYYCMDSNIKDIASGLNISESNVKNYLYRTLKELKVLMESEGGENE